MDWNRVEGGGGERSKLNEREDGGKIEKEREKKIERASEMENIPKRLLES